MLQLPYSRGGRNRTHLWSFGDSYSTDELHPYTAVLGLQHRYYNLKSKKTQYLITSYFKVYTLKTSYRFKLRSKTWSSPRPISNSQLHVLLHFHLCPIYLVVFKGSYFPKEGISHLEGGFTLRCLQRLSRPNLATLPCRWSTTDTPVVRPSRSSRTKDSSSQISSAHAG